MQENIIVKGNEQTIFHGFERHDSNLVSQLGKYQNDLFILELGSIKTVNIYETTQTNIANLNTFGLIGGAFYLLVVVFGLFLKPLSEFSFRTKAITKMFKI